MSQSRPSIYRRRPGPSPRRFLLASLLLGLWGSAAAAAEPPTELPSVTLFVVGAPEARASVQAWAQEQPPGVPVTLRLAGLPAPTARPGGDVQLLEVERHLQEARRHYIHAEFAECLQEVGDEGVLPRTLSQGHREVVARWLLWQVACQVGLRREEAALQVASELGVLGLELPVDIGVLPPDVGRVLVTGAEQGAARGRTTLRITSDSSPARISLDGRLGVCMAPCSLEVLEGRHVVRVDAEGRQFAVQVISAKGPELAVAFTTLPASPELAAGQWATHYGESSANLDSAGSLRLLSTALRAPRLVLLNAEAEREGYRLRGALAIHGRAAARTERQGDVKALHGTAEGVLRDLLIQGQVVEPAPALYQRRDFWIAVGVAAVIAGATTTALLWRQPVRTEVGF
ncbi:PEGA domain-containing protein [Myxococcus vastator]|uniref:PEGA domain-containing protein n=1 Tax=Myxococcus vastator TaxID=2709664 RepID=UPI0013CF6F48|nr:PEGA domain-containing protein [Myxococcus vastator]